MAQVYEIELPNGQVVEFEGDAPPTKAQQNQILAQALPKYTASSSDTEAILAALDDEAAFALSRAKPGELIGTKDWGEIISVGGGRFVAPYTEFQKAESAKKADESSELGALVRAGVLDAPSAAAATATFGAVAQKAQGLRSIPRVGPALAFGVPLGASIVSAIGTRMAVDQALPAKGGPISQERVQKDLEQQPTAVTAGSVLSSLPFFGVGGIQNGLRRELARRAVPAAIGGGVQAGTEIASAPEGEGVREGALKRIGIAAVGNALLDQPTKLGDAVMGLGAKIAGRKPLVAVVDGVAAKMNPKEANAAANDVALGRGGADIAEAGDPAVSLPEAPKFGADAAELPEDDPLWQLVENYRAKKATNDASVDAATAKAAKEAEVAAWRKDLGLAELGLDAEQSAKAMDELMAAREAAEKAANYAGAEFTPEKATLGELMGQEVEYLGYKGKLIRDQEGNYGVLQAVTDGSPNFVEIADSGKDAASIASKLGVKQLPVEVRPLRSEPGMGVNKISEPAPVKEPATTKPTEASDPEPVRISSDDEDAIAEAAEAQAKRKNAAFIEPRVMANVSAPAVGAAIGYQFGDTPEERRRNAVYGALLASGGVLSAQASKSLGQKSGAVKERLLAAIRDSKETQAGAIRPRRDSVWEDYVNPREPQPPAENIPSPALDVDLPGYKYTQTLSRSAFGAAAKHTLGLISTNIRSVSPKIWGVLQKYEFKLHDLKKHWSARASALGTLARQTLSPADFEKLNLAILNRDVVTAESILAAYPNADELTAALKSAQDTIEEMRLAQVESGREVPVLDDYFPRKIVDYDAFRKGLDADELGVIDKLFKQAKNGKGAPLTMQEKEDIVNNLIQFSRRGEGRPGYLKKRTIEKLDAKMAEFYEPFDVALDNYVSRVSRDIVNREYFGKFSPMDPDAPYATLEGNLGRAVAEEAVGGALPPAGQKIVLDNLRARFISEVSMDDAISRVTDGIRKATSLAFLGDVTTSVAQFGDVIMTMRRYGMLDTAKGYIGREIPLSEVIHTPDEDLVEFSKAVKSGRFNTLVNKVLNTTIGKADRFNKDGSLNAAWNHLQRVVKDTGSMDFYRLNNKYKSVYGDEWTNSMLPDIQAGKLTDGVRLTLFNELSEMQPISPSEMPPLYNQDSRAKLIYSLKSYWLKQLDIVRREGYEKLKSKNTMLEGVANLATYALAIGAQGFAIDYTRDLILGRESTTEDYFLANLMRVFGVSRYHLYKAKQDGPAEAGFAMAIPFAQVVKDAYTDYRGVVSGSVDSPMDLESVKYLPFAGRILYWQFGKGKEKTRKAQEKRLDGKEESSMDAIRDFIAPKKKEER
jgi:hypothetical protein